MRRLMGLFLILFVMVGVTEAGEWVIETVDLAGDVGKCNSLALDSSGNPHISYYDETNENLKYAHWDGSVWQIETVDSVGGVNHYHYGSSLALDSSDNPHISYYDGNQFIGDLKYARWNGAAWQIETVDSEGNVGVFNSLALDSSDNPHISYPRWDLKYARWDGSNWQIEEVDYEYEADVLTNSMKLDSSEYPHIAFHRNSNEYTAGWLRYAQWDGSG